ncbi:unnamed protein product [Spodoptera littoralis]|uniref:Uncharacterized protein n=1 Tax=Spodoptera littoralis TaxID=7109 RepID=A0A9P0I3C2_SPOLI|nr:unnamed protein product [Spodoptera littoralis]CAH1639403.1 unnamed protein product [Spodoptera littoralis]
MSCYSKENLNKNDYNNVCKSHSARSDREIYRICPSKLSKRELEDLYFSLLENNLELKRTVNGQHDTIKGLSTKVQRMTTAQRLLQGKEFKDCCVGSKFVINEQRESITELRRANQKLSDKLQQLNMRLCSAKQFHRKSPSQASTSRCVRCATVTTGAPMMRSPMSPNSVQTEDDRNNKGCSQLTCDENKCKTAMQELKMKIANLQEELNMVHEDYSARLSRLETEVLDVRRENVRVSGERTASLHQLETSLQKNGEVLAEYRTAEARCAELEAQLVVERRRVAELETQLKAANMSDKVNRTIEDRLSSINETNGTTKSATNGTPKSNISGITNFPHRTFNGTTKTKGITRATSGAMSRTMASSTLKTIPNSTTKSVTNGTTKSTTNGITRSTTNGTNKSTTNGITKPTTNGTTKATPKGTPVVAIPNVPQATATTTEITDAKAKTNETTTTDANISSNVVTDDNMTTDVTKTATTDDNIPTQATETATTKDYSPTSATSDDNIPTNATTDDNIPIIATKTATTDGTGSPTRDTQETADSSSKPTCQCIEIIDDKPNTAARESVTKESKPHDCDCTSNQMLEAGLAGASSTSATKEDSRCRKCCYKELDVRVMESIAKVSYIYKRKSC